MSGIGHKAEARSTNYLFTIGQDRELSFAVQNSNVTEVNLNTTPFPVGPKDLKLPSNKAEMSSLTIDFVVSEDYNEWVEIFKWIMICKNKNNSFWDHVRFCELTALDSQNQPTVRFKYKDVFPTLLEGITYAVNDENSNTIVSGATFEYNEFYIELPDGTIIDEKYGMLDNQE